MYPGATAFFTSPSLKWDNRAIELRPFLRGRGDVLNPRWAGGFQLRIADDLGVLGVLLLRMNTYQYSEILFSMMVCPSVRMSVILGAMLGRLSSRI